MKNIIFSVIALCFGVLSGVAKGYQTLPAILDGSMSLYDFSAVEPRLLPDSLSPVHISYIAQHGARYLTSESKITKVEKTLNKARSRGTLTKKGKDFMALMERVRKATDGQWGMLSPIGKAQELRLGREMVRMYPEVFTAKGSQVTAGSSYVPRVIETMDQFIIAISDTIDGIATSAYSGHSYDHLVRFFVTDPAYDKWRHSGVWKEVFKDYSTRMLPFTPAEALVGKDSGFSDEELRGMSYDMYKVLQGLRAMGLDAPTTEWMTPEEYASCWRVTNLEKYFQYSLSSLSSIPAEGASDVLMWLVQEQMALQNDSEQLSGLSGLFGHAETLLPVFALLGVPTMVALPLDYDNLANEWSDAVLTPLAANLAIIYSKAPNGELYASMRLNGKNVSPVNDPAKMIVSVTELRDYWLSRYLQLSNLGRMVK